MRIKLDDNHYLNSDQYCYWITCEFINDKGKLMERRVSGYKPTIDTAVESYIDKRINTSEAVKITQLANDVKKLKKDIKTWKVCLEVI